MKTYEELLTELNYWAMRVNKQLVAKVEESDAIANIELLIEKKKAYLLVINDIKHNSSDESWSK